MVYAKGVAFKVNKQTPIFQGPAQAYGTVINCRKPGGKRAGREQKEVQSHHVPLSNIPGTLKRKRGEEAKHEFDQATNLYILSRATTTELPDFPVERPLVNQPWLQHKPTRLRKGKISQKGVDLDCWFTILSFSDPAQLLEMREKIALCYRFLRDNPMLWKHSRNFYYGSSMPDPPSQLTELQYAMLRHGHGCDKCKAPNTRKTYWAFFRRWCKTCLAVNIVKEAEMVTILREGNVEDISLLYKCLPSGIFDSWGNFVGVGPATTHSLKTVFIRSDVEKIVAEYNEKTEECAGDKTVMREWHAEKVALIDERRVFAKRMEHWEESVRSTKSLDYQQKKSRRKEYFRQKAAQLDPPVSQSILEACPSYRRAIVIPKEPNNTSWLQLKPKLEKEAAALVAKQAPPPEPQPATCSLAEICPQDSIMNAQQMYMDRILPMPFARPHFF